MPRPRLLDWLVAGLLGAASLYEIHVETLMSPGWPGSAGIETVALLLLVAGLLLRRTMPLRALLLVGLSAALQHVVMSDPDEYQVSFEVFLALLLTSYTVVVSSDRLRALQALVVVFALHVAVAAWKPSGAATEDAIGMFVVLTLIWFAGSAVRARQERIGQLERDRALEARAAVTDERARIARELHDIVAHAVSVMVVQIGAARHTLRGKPEVAEESMQLAEAAGREALTEMRRLVGLMREEDAAVEPTPGVSALPALARRFETSGMPVSLEVGPALGDLPAGLDLTVYRVVQEGLTNALKHAGAVPTHVEVARSNGHLRVAVRNAAGRGEGGGSGHGLIGLRERVALYGGRLETDRAADGFALKVELPL